jgi:hypothetical protein
MEDCGRLRTVVEIKLCRLTYALRIEVHHLKPLSSYGGPVVVNPKTDLAAVCANCYRMIHVKVVDFEPEFAGKMNFYLSAVDDLLRHPEDQPSVGLILCKGRSRVVAEYALRDMTKPIGVSAYQLMGCCRSSCR